MSLPSDGIQLGFFSIKKVKHNKCLRETFEQMPIGAIECSIKC